MLVQWQNNNAINFNNCPTFNGAFNGTYHLVPHGAGLIMISKEFAEFFIEKLYL